MNEDTEPYSATERALAIAAYIIVPLMAIGGYFAIAKALL